MCCTIGRPPLLVFVALVFVALALTGCTDKPCDSFVEILGPGCGFGNTGGRG